jgi:hypothetical protein
MRNFITFPVSATNSLFICFSIPGLSGAPYPRLLATGLRRHSHRHDLHVVAVNNRSKVIRPQKHRVANLRLVARLL